MPPWLEERIAVEVMLGRETRVLGELESLVREYPYRERLQGQLMLALYRVGRQADALATYRAATAGRLWTLAERLEQQIGVRMVRAERVRYERTLAPALRDEPRYRAGVANAVGLDPLAAVADLLRG